MMMAQQATFRFEVRGSCGGGGQQPVRDSVQHHMLGCGELSQTEDHLNLARPKDRLHTASLTWRRSSGCCNCDGMPTLPQRRGVGKQAAVHGAQPRGCTVRAHGIQDFVRSWFHLRSARPVPLGTAVGSASWASCTAGRRCTILAREGVRDLRRKARWICAAL